MSDVAIGIDVGTTAIKVAAYLSDGSMVGSAQRPSPVEITHDGAAEQDMALVWSLTAECLKELSQKLEGHTPISVGICAQGDGLWPVDQRGDPVRPALLWSDTRSDISVDLEDLREKGQLATVARGCNTALWPGSQALAWRWLRDAEPENAARTSHVLTCGDWIALKLTGRIATDLANATIPFLDLQTSDYGPDQIAALECEDIVPRLPELRRATEVLGSVTPEAAQLTGLDAGLTVAVATLDVGSMVVGMGLSQPGETMLILGTTAVVTVIADRVEPTGDPVGATSVHPSADVFVRGFAPTTGTAAFDWFASLHPQTLAGDDAAVVGEKLNLLAGDVPIGANGVTFLPYLNGERAPFVQPAVRGMFHGLSAATNQAEMARAVLEGAAFSLRHCFEAEGGLPQHPVNLTGGGARNPLWCQIIADTIGQDVLVDTAADLGLWGAACLGLAALRGGDPVTYAQRDRDVATYRARSDHHQAYDKVYARYEILSRAERDIQKSLSNGVS